jgi:hypothetical protein
MHRCCLPGRRCAMRLRASSKAKWKPRYACNKSTPFRDHGWYPKIQMRSAAQRLQLPASRLRSQQRRASHTAKLVL